MGHFGGNCEDGLPGLRPCDTPARHRSDRRRAWRLRRFAASLSPLSEL